MLNNGDIELTGTPIPHDGDTACARCGTVMDPVATLYSPTGLCVDCDRAYAAQLAQNRMVAPR